MPHDSEEEPKLPAHPLVACADFAAAVALGTAVVIVPLVFSSATPYGLDIKYLFAGGCALVAGAAMLVRSAAGGLMPPKSRAMTGALALFFGAVVLSTAASGHRGVAVREMWWYAAHVLMFTAAAVVFRRRAWAAAFAAAVLVGAALVAGITCLQAAGMDPLAASWEKAGQGRIDLVRARALGTMGLETILGGYSATCSVLALGAALLARRGIVRAAAGLVAVCTAVAMVLSGTRTAWLAFLVGLIILASGIDLSRLLRPRTRAGAAALAALAALLVFGAVRFGPMVADRVGRLGEHLPTRTTIWRSALAMCYASPVLGKGPGTFSVHFPEFRPADYFRYDVKPITLWAHSEYLEILAETGFVGMTAFVIFLGLFLLGSARELGEPGGASSPLFLPAFAAASTMLVHAVANVDTRYPTCRMMMWVMMGFAVSQWRDEKPGAARPAGRWTWAGVAVLVAAAVPVWFLLVWQPYEARVWLRRATNEQKARLLDASVASARRSVEIDPLSTPSRYVLGNSLFYAGRYEAALEAFRTLDADSPNYSDVPLRIAVLNARLGRLDAARAALARARCYGVAWGEWARSDELTDEQLAALANEFEKDKR